MAKRLGREVRGFKEEEWTAARFDIVVRGNVAKFAQTVASVPDDFAVMIGNGTVFCEALQAGARGGILAVGCAASELCIEIYRAVQVGEIDRASSLQEKLTPLALAVTKTYGIGGLKTAMDMAGYVGGAVRAPLQLPDETARGEIESSLREAVAPFSKPPFAKVSEARP